MLAAEKGWLNEQGKTPMQSVMDSDFREFVYCVSLFLVSNAKC